ncbi:MAG: hypothetical protein IKQ41_04005 [Clostridia bacterium]|nr:hypothetical protein [Clostridia bacterium]
MEEIFVDKQSPEAGGRRGEDKSFHDVFERADALMYEEKKLLKGMGAITRDGAEETQTPAKP